MHIKSIKWRNIKSFGNKLQEIEFPDEGGLHLISGRNGNGKCLSKETKVNIKIINNKDVRDKFLNFLKK